VTPSFDPKPPRLARLLLRLRPLGTRRAEVAADLDEVFAERAAAEGAARAARRYYRDVLSLWTWNLSGRRLVGDAAQDLAYGLRVFRRNPGAVAITVVGLSLAIAVSTSVFSLLNATLLRGTGVSDPGTAVRVMRAFKDGHGIATSWSYADYVTLRDHARLPVEATLADHARFTISPPGRRSLGEGGPGRRSLGEGGPSDDTGEPVRLTFVGEGYLRGFGARPLHGRILQPVDDSLGAPPVVVASYGFWLRRLAADPSVVGRQIWLNGIPATIVGVAPRSFIGFSDEPPAFWAPFASYHSLYSGSPLTRRSEIQVNVYGRMPSGVTRTQAEAELGAVAAAAATPEPHAGLTAGVRLDPAGSRFRGPDGAVVVLVVTFVLTLLGLVVLLACVNVANLQLASAIARQREIGVRLALGAARARIIRQLVTESLALGLAAGAIALLLTTWLGPTLAAVVRFPVTVDMTPDVRVYLFLWVISIAAGIGAGLAPARHGTQGDLLTPLKGDGPRAGSGRPSRMRSTLIGVQAAASLVLLVLAALLTRATISATQVDIGFDAKPLVTIAPAFGGERPEAAKTQAYFDRALERLRGLPNVRAASLALYSPYSGLTATRTLTRNGVRYKAYLNETPEDYFSTLGLRFVRGRAYTTEEVRARAKVVVISETLARDFWPGQDPVGQPLTPLDGSTDTVVGVVADAITAALYARSAAAVYRPLQRVEAGPSGSFQVLPSIVVRTGGAPEAVVPAIRDTLQALDPRVRLDIGLVATGLQNEVEEPRILAVVAGALATLALGLALVGIYGVTTFVTGQRTREIGLRIAIGASRGDVVRLLLEDSLRPVAIGLAAGAGVALVASRLIAVVFYGVGASDPMAFASAIAVLLVSAAAAVFIPARRAARVDPAFVLRQS
jgi:putative ABC transport system permease protein